MFNECSSLKKVDISSFNTENINRMELMFNGCKSLEGLNLSNFNTKNTRFMNLRLQMLIIKGIGFI